MADLEVATAQVNARRIVEIEETNILNLQEQINENQRLIDQETEEIAAMQSGIISRRQSIKHRRLENRMLQSQHNILQRARLELHLAARRRG